MTLNIKGEILGNVHFVRTPVEILDDGVKLINKEDSSYQKEELFKCDYTIIAISKKLKNNIVSNTINIEINRAGLIIADEKGSTTRWIDLLEWRYCFMFKNLNLWYILL